MLQNNTEDSLMHRRGASLSENELEFDIALNKEEGDDDKKE